MDDLPEIAIVIPFYNGDEVIQACLDSIARCTVVGHCAVFVVDNSAAPTRVAEIAARFPFARVIKTPPALGFGRACNTGAAAATQAGARHLVFLNQDTVLAPDCLQKMIEAFAGQTDLGIVGPVNWSIDFEAFDGTFARYYLDQSPDFVADAVRGRLKSSYPVERLIGSCIAIPTTVYRALGLFDEIYWMYSEDDDLCRRYQLAGLRLALVAHAHVGHVNGQTSSPDVLRIVRLKRSSNQRFRLKDTSFPFGLVAVMLVRDALLDYFRMFSACRFSLLADFVRDDLQLLANIARIQSAREQEMRLVRSARADPPYARGRS